MSCIFSTEGWEFANVEFRHHDGSESSRNEMIHQKTGRRYLSASPCEVACKCSLLFLGIFPYLAFYVAIHTVRAPLTAATSLFESLHRFYEAPTIRHIVQIVSDPFSSFAKEVWGIVRAPFYAIKMQFASLYGVFRPFEGLQLLEKAERRWHQKPRRADLRDDSTSLRGFLTQPDYPNTFYLAACMQSLGTVRDPHLIKIEPFS